MGKRQPSPDLSAGSEAESTLEGKKPKVTPRKRQKTANAASPVKRVKKSSSVQLEDDLVAVNGEWPDWPAPPTAMERAREFIRDM
ncbi:hypothetical protein QFC22_001741 [Naganishia vaughanmartiniae]|uniref:Uncharacterized protein n=1 Tax=Naganishia vaughanmartiniae TaxID=1424756 RepID=A0ACC2XE53_9TREE|nr:hypothetical protein QFC22_001741 [Naganishia vaughanmartiniae]